MLARKYAQALQGAFEGKTATEQGKILTQFLKRVKERGHEKVLPQVKHFLTKGLQKERGEFLLVAKKGDVARARKEAGTKVGATIVPNLIGGWQHYKQGILTDTSYKRSLIDLYRRITK